MIQLSAIWRRSLLALSAMGAAATASAQTTTPVAFTPGNYVVVRVGDGTVLATGAAAATFLQEYTATGTLVQTIALPTAASGNNLPFTETSTSTADASLSRSVDGRYLVLTGYNAAPGLAGLSSTASSATNRLVARIAANGSIDTSTRINDAFSATTVRGATSANGSSFYVVGGSSGVVMVPLGNAGASTAISTGSPVNDRTALLYGGNLYVSSGSSPTYGVVQVGTGLPTTSNQTQTLLPGFSSTVGASSYAFFFTDQSPAVAGADVLYVADDGSTTTSTAGIQKWSLVNGTWTLNGTIGAATGGTAAVRGLTGTQAGSVVTLAATGATGLYVLTDIGGYNAAPSTTTLPAMPVATPIANAAFRGLALAPLATALATRGQASPQELALYPNPAQDVLTVALADGASAAGHRAEVHDLLGRAVLAATLPASGQLRLAGLAPGTYLLTVDGTLTRRISKVE